MLQQTPARPGEPDPDIIFELMLAPIRLAVLNAALEMEMADVLANATDLPSIATRLNVKNGDTNLAYLLDAMVSMGFATKNDGVYSNTSFAENHLRKDSPSYLGGLVETLSRRQHRNLGCIAELVRNGPPEVNRKERLHEESLWQQSVRHLASYQKAGMARRVADLISSLPEFPAMKRMLDIGCGPGVMCMAVVQRHPSLHGVLCDLPTVMEVALEEMAAAGMESRISTIDGNYNEVDFGTGYDLIWASQTLYYARDLGAMLTRICKALNPGGLFISLHEGLTEERTQPAEIILSRLSLALEGQDVSFEKGEIASLLPEAGFSFVETRIMDLPIGPTELIIGRKKG